MKVTVALALFAACVAASAAGPRAPRAINWDSVQAKVNEIHGIVRDGVSQVKKIANDDNATVGESISQQLDAATSKAMVVFERAQTAIDGQSLTVEQAEQNFSELEGILENVRNDLQDEIAQLSEGASNQIRGIFRSSYAQVDTKADELYTLLRQ